MTEALSLGTLRLADSLSVNAGQALACEAKYPEFVEGLLKDMDWFVYIAVAKSGYYYVGISPNPQERILLHNSGAGSQMAKQHGSFELLYVSPPFPGKSEARFREVQLKGWSRKKKEKLIKGEWE